MAKARLPMRKIKEVLRLKFELGRGHREIARSCGIGHSTVFEYLQRAAAAGIGWPLPEGLTEAALQEKLIAHYVQTFDRAPQKIADVKKFIKEVAEL